MNYNQKQVNLSDSLSHKNSMSSVSPNTIRRRPSNNIFSKPRSMNSSCELKTQDDTMSQKFLALKTDQKKKFLVQDDMQINHINEGRESSSVKENSGESQISKPSRSSSDVVTSKSGEHLRTLITNFMKDIDTINRSNLSMKSENSSSSDLDVQQEVINLKGGNSERNKSSDRSKSKGKSKNKEKKSKYSP